MSLTYRAIGRTATAFASAGVLCIIERASGDRDVRRASSRSVALDELLRSQQARTVATTGRVWAVHECSQSGAATGCPSHAEHEPRGGLLGQHRGRELLRHAHQGAPAGDDVRYAEACREVVRFIEWWYNRGRRHSSLDYRTPVEHEREILGAAEITVSTKPPGHVLTSACAARSACQRWRC